MYLLLFGEFMFWLVYYSIIVMAFLFYFLIIFIKNNILTTYLFCICDHYSFDIPCTLDYLNPELVICTNFTFSRSYLRLKAPL